MKSEGIKGKILSLSLILFYPFFWFFTKNCYQGTQTTFYTLFSNDVENGYYYADCAKSIENKYVLEENWIKLWEVS